MPTTEPDEEDDGAYEVGPEPGAEPREYRHRAIRLPGPPPFLPYRPPKLSVNDYLPVAGVPFPVQVAIGAAAHWVIILTFAKIAGDHDWGRGDVVTSWIILAPIVIIVAAIASTPLRWRGLIVGALIGVGTSCFLSPVFLCSGKFL